MPRFVSPSKTRQLTGWREYRRYPCMARRYSKTHGEMVREMTVNDADGVIRRLTLKHREVNILSTQVNGDVCCITFEYLPVNLVTVGNWIERAGGVPQQQGILGSGDRQVCYAVFK